MAMKAISTLDVFILLTFALCLFIFLLFLPSILELKRPKDPGPRKISEIANEKGD